jgi:PPK2 family polyphosphate:nucleotide phosphotransferase
MDIRKRLMAHSADGYFSLSGVDPDDNHGVNRKQAEKDLAKHAGRITDLQDRLWAEGRRTVLVVLQGMDTSGKDGTIKHAMTPMNPQGVRVVGFKQPTPEEQRHNFLWRIRRALPDPPHVVIFNRSHYEDVLVARVRKLVTERVVESRYEQINRFEEELLRRHDTTILKFCLHISYDEQRKRLLERLHDPTKLWKFSETDISVRSQWDEYMAAYDLAIARCSTPQAPWYVIPANKKWFRNWAAARILIDTLAEMNPTYPKPRLDIPGLEAKLKAS